ncbi:MAG TPA: YnfA family protein [Bacteroidia bacterium]|nr:YnfA family protein [Bacteroidia bacterium]
MKNILFYAAAALCEIGGCFAFWAWLRMDRAWWWTLPGAVLLVLFAWCLTRIDVDHAGRADAAYGGIYIVSSVLWLLLAERVVPDRWDCIGAVVCLAGAGIILYGPR